MKLCCEIFENDFIEVTKDEDIGIQIQTRADMYRNTIYLNKEKAIKLIEEISKLIK